MRKVAIVTAASQGLGAACARELSQKGYDLAIMARSEKIKVIGKELGAIVIQGSVTQEEDLAKIVDVTMEKFGRIDVVVNNTGHPAKGPLLELSDEDWRIGLDLIVLSVTRMAKIITPIMEKQGSGSIVNISTFSAFEPSLSFPISSSMRAALASYTKLYSDEYASSGIRMNNVLPGFMDSYEVTEEIRASIPMMREAEVSEVAKAVGFLASKESSYITGQNLKVDGGLSRAV